MITGQMRGDQTARSQADRDCVPWNVDHCPATDDTVAPSEVPTEGRQDKLDGCDTLFKIAFARRTFVAPLDYKVIPLARSGRREPLLDQVADEWPQSLPIAVQ